MSRVIKAASLAFPGLFLCIGVTGLAVLLQNAERHLFGRAWLEALVLAILVGTAMRTAWTPDRRWMPGIDFSAKFLLEIAVVLLGASVSAATVVAAGPALLAGIAGVVVLAIGASYAMGRLMGLPRRLATLIACGNSICGNSAIAAVAPVIGANGEDVAASIAFTAVLGVVMVMALPLAMPLLRLTGLQYGALAGLTVYAVPQVLAATAQAGAAAMQMGTLVKLVRVLMLGPVVVILSILTSRLRNETDELPPHVTAGKRPRAGHPPLHRLVPWFIVGFLLLSAARSAGLVPATWLAPIASVAGLLTIVSMAALGLSTDLRVVVHAGARVTTVVVASLLTLGALSLALIGAIHLR